MPLSASVAVIGGGVVGASIAYHLAARGVRDVLVVDRAAVPAAGSTGRATGGFRAQFDSAVNVRLSLLARSKLLRFRDETGVDPGYVPAGYLWIAETAAELERLRAALRVQQRAGLSEARELGPTEAAEASPGIRHERIVGATFCQTDGFIDPTAILAGYISAGQRLGVRYEWGVDVQGIRRNESGRAASLVTSRGPVAIAAAVNAAGAWAGTVGLSEADPVPVTPLCRQVAVTAPTDALPAGMPMTIFATDGFHLRVRAERVLLLHPGGSRRRGSFEIAVDEEWLTMVRAICDERVPALAGVPLDRGQCYGGLYEMSPDGHAIVGASPSCDNLYLAVGCSGHGVMHAPALGQLLSELICDGIATSADISPLRPGRFAERVANPEAALL